MACNRSASSAGISVSSDDSSSYRRRIVGRIARRFESKGATLRNHANFGNVAPREKASSSSLMDLLQNVRLRQVGTRRETDNVTPVTAVATSTSSIPHSNLSEPMYFGSVYSSHERRKQLGDFGASYSGRSTHSLPKPIKNIQDEREKASSAPFQVHSAIREESSTRESSSQLTSSLATRKNISVRRLLKAVNSNARMDHIKHLIDDDPSAVGCSVTGGGPTPLHCAINRYDYGLEILEYMLQACPEASSKRYDGNNCVDLLWIRSVDPPAYRRNDFKEAAAVLRGQIEDLVSKQGGPSAATVTTNSAGSSVTLPQQVQDFWSNILPFITAAAKALEEKDAATATATKKSPAKRFIVHDCLAINAPPLLVRLAAYLHPQDMHIHMNRSRGHLPIHVAAINGLGCLNDVVALNPSAAALCDSDGRTPLHHAIHGCTVTWEQGINALVHAHPQGLFLPDPNTALSPVLQAACADVELSTLFQLLKACPQETIGNALSPRRNHL